ncbi:MAG: hypothetical protein FGM50_06000 [Mycobacterium sp.]|nr:hypothetical protein [Mycobacterium sp.]
MTRRRVLAMSWSVVIAVLHAGVGIASATPAGAEPSAPGSESAADTAPTRGNPAGRSDEHPRQAPARASWQRPPTDRRIGMAPTLADGTQPTRGSAAVPDQPEHPEHWEHWEHPDHWEHWDCHWPVWPPVPLPDVAPVDGLGAGGGGNGLILVAAVALRPPTIPAPPTALGAATNRNLTGLTAAEPPPAAAPAAAASEGRPLGGPFPPPPPPGTAAASTPPAAPPAPAAVPAAASAEAPKAVAPQLIPLRVGYPDYLKDATWPQIAALALTGAAGLAALAGAGGFVGYRQAKAGFALRAAGTARFLS